MIRLLVLMAFSSVASAGVSYAWWVDAEFPVSGTEVLGVPVQEIDSSWVKARALAMSDVPEDTGDDMVRWQMQEYDLHFSLSDDLDDDGDIEQAAVVIYEAEDGQQGTGVVVFGPKGSVELSWTARTDKAGFGVIWKTEKGFSFAYCLECGDLVDFERQGKDHYMIVVPEPYGWIQ
ncbi:MAG: hypothetical protein R3270_03595 [Gammaproteobacteria bacterium]|nr:hypothetical protein [Gammaproteobacteria bacterium]